MGLREDDRARLARAIQDGVPLEPEPFEVLAAGLGLAAADVLAQLESWFEAGQLREISAVLEGSALGYDSALAAAAVGGGRIDLVAAQVSQLPTVTHCYARDHHYDLWFTLAVPHEMGIERTLSLLSAEAGGVPLHALRRTATFKIGVNFDVETRENRTASQARVEVPPLCADERTRGLLAALQTPLPLVRRPFAALAAGAGSSEGELLALGKALLGRGVVRRYAATFRHRKLGVRGNGMAVWNVPPAELEEVGRRFAAAPEVSHCYARDPIPGFSYRLYTMVHGPDAASVRAVVARLARDNGRYDHEVLFSSREYKKCRLRFFLPELDAWWARRVEEVAA
jgi:DNA-binding Lrp family transcriptional regulator